MSGLINHEEAKGAKVGGVAIEVLRKFCEPGHPAYSEPFNMWNYRGGSRVNYDVCATNNKVLLCIHGCRLPDAKEERCGAPPSWWWAMEAIAENDAEVRKASDKTIRRVPEATREQLQQLPGLEFKEVPRVNVWSHGRGKPKQKLEKVDDAAVVFFSFTGGAGCCAAFSKPSRTSRSSRLRGKRVVESEVAK